MALDGQEYNRNVARAADYMWSWLRTARPDFEFAALKQWREEDREALEQQMRPALVFDVTRPLIKAVSGAETTNRYKAKFKGFNLGLEENDRKAAEVFDYFYSWCRIHGKNEHHESLAFQDLAVCGLAALETYIDYSRFKDGLILTTRVPIFDCGFDPSAIDPNLMDRWFCYRDRFVPESTFRRIYPDADEVILSLKAQEKGKMEGAIEKVRRKVGRAYTRDNLDYNNGHEILMTGFDRATHSIRVRDYQWKELDYQVRIIGRDTNGSIQFDEFIPNHTADKVFGELQASQGAGEANTPDALTYERVNNHPVERYFRAHVAGNYVLAEEETGLRHFTLQFLTAEEDWSQYIGDKGSGYKSYFGLMRSMRDPQQYRNKFFSQAVHIFNANPKGLLIYETDMFEDVHEAMDAWAKAEGSIGVEPGKLNGPHGPKFQHINQQFSFSGTEPLFQNATRATYEAAGINPAVTGGQAEDLRRVASTSLDTVKDSNLASLSNYFDALRLYRTVNADLTLELARTNMTLETIQRIVGTRYAQDAHMIYQTEIQDFDIVVEEVESGNTPTEDMFTAVMQNLPNMLQMGFPIPPEIFEYVAAFLPTDVAQAWTEQIRQFNAQKQQGTLPPGNETGGGNTGETTVQ